MASTSGTPSQLEAAPGHWAPATACVVYREACPRSSGGGLVDESCPGREVECRHIMEANATVDGRTCQPLLPFAYQPCDWHKRPELVGQVLQSLPQSPVDEDFPYACASGLVGTADPSEQGSSRCAGPCPAGKLCGPATILPQSCARGHYVSRTARQTKPFYRFFALFCAQKLRVYLILLTPLSLVQKLCGLSSTSIVLSIKIGVEIRKFKHHSLQHIKHL